MEYGNATPESKLLALTRTIFKEIHHLRLQDCRSCHRRRYYREGNDGPDQKTRPYQAVCGLIWCQSDLRISPSLFVVCSAAQCTYEAADARLAACVHMSGQNMDANRKISEVELQRRALQRAMSIAEFCQTYGIGRTTA